MSAPTSLEGITHEQWKVELDALRNFMAAEEAFTCPRCGDHQFSTDRPDEEDSDTWRVVCHHDKCGWSGKYGERVNNAIPAISPKVLFAQLREMGVRCHTCKYRHGETTAENGCSIAPYVKYCSGWEAGE